MSTFSPSETRPDGVYASGKDIERFLQKLDELMKLRDENQILQDRCNRLEYHQQDMESNLAGIKSEIYSFGPGLFVSAKKIVKENIL